MDKYVNLMFAASLAFCWSVQSLILIPSALALNPQLDSLSKESQNNPSPQPVVSESPQDPAADIPNNSGTMVDSLPTQSLDALIEKVRRSFRGLNFEASFVLVKDKFVEPYNWMHSFYQEQEIEYIRSQNGYNREIVRKGDLVGYFEAETEPYAVKSRAIQGILPAIFYDETIVLGDYYSIAKGGKRRILDRVAQQFRIVSRDDYRHDFWLWLDVKTGMLLKSALVSKDNQVLEQFQLTHLTILDDPPPLVSKVIETRLPKPLITQNQIDNIRWQLNWLPSGFRVIAANQHRLTLTGEFADYILASDGLVDLSIYIQQPISNKLQSGSLRNGSNVVFVQRNKTFDVTIIGKVPSVTAERIAKGVMTR